MDDIHWIHAGPKTEVVKTRTHVLEFDEAEDRPCTCPLLSPDFRLLLVQVLAVNSVVRRTMFKISITD
jgi:hypothetical protein